MEEAEEKGKMEGKAEGKAEGIEEKAAEIAAKLLHRGDFPETVAEIVNFPIDKIKKLAKDIKK